MRLIPNSFGAGRQSSALREYNTCHEPGGTPVGGRFARKGTAGCAPGQTVPDAAPPLAVPEGQDALPYDPPLGGSPSPDLIAHEAEMRALLTEGNITDDEDLGGGISESRKITITAEDEDETEVHAVWKPEDGERWTVGDIKRAEGEGDPEENRPGTDQDALLEAMSEAEGEGWQQESRDYVKMVEDRMTTLVASEWKAAVEKRFREGAIKEILDPEQQGGTQDVLDDTWNYVYALFGEEEGEGGGIFDDQEGHLLPGYEEKVLAVVDKMIEDGMTHFMPTLNEPDPDDIRKYSKYFNEDDGFSNWVDDGFGESYAQEAADNFRQRRDEEWNEQVSEEWERPIRDTISNRDFPHAQREAAAYELDRLIGIGTTPVTVHRTDYNGAAGSVQQFVYPKKSSTSFDVEQKSTQDGYLRGAIFDYLIGNTDRHGGNYIAEGGHVYTIDNGLTFADGPGERRSEFFGYARRAINEGAAQPKTLAQLHKGLLGTNWETWSEKWPMSDSEREDFLYRVERTQQALTEAVGGKLDKLSKLFW